MEKTEKLCPKCGLTKPVAEFYPIKARHDGLSYACRPCTLSIEKKKYVRHPRWKAPEGTKKCGKCKEVKPVEQFGKNRSSYDGMQNYCKPCGVQAVLKSREANPDSHRRASKEWREKNEKNRLHHYETSLRTRIGKHVARGTYAELFDKQGGKCAICKTAEPQLGHMKRFHMDHNHTTNRVRGLLCGACNSILGYAKDNPDILDAAKAYLYEDQALTEALREGAGGFNPSPEG